MRFLLAVDFGRFVADPVKITPDNIIVLGAVVMALAIWMIVAHVLDARCDPESSHYSAHAWGFGLVGAAIGLFGIIILLNS